MIKPILNRIMAATWALISCRNTPTIRGMPGDIIDWFLPRCSAVGKKHEAIGLSNQIANIREVESNQGWSWLRVQKPGMPAND